MQRTQLGGSTAGGGTWAATTSEIQIIVEDLHSRSSAGVISRLVDDTLARPGRNDPQWRRIVHPRKIQLDRGYEAALAEQHLAIERVVPEEDIVTIPIEVIKHAVTVQLPRALLGAPETEAVADEPRDVMSVATGLAVGVASVLEVLAVMSWVFAAG